jgi:hypothetical protein
MDGERVRDLEAEIGRAIADVLARRAPEAAVDPRTLHLMAKAAVTVLEAVSAKDRPAPR